MTCVTGVSGSGKSSLVIETLFHEAQRSFFDPERIPTGGRIVLSGLENLDKVIDIDQSPIGRTPRSNPATYTGVMTPMRELLARLPESGHAATSPVVSASISRAGAAKPAKGTAVKIAMHFLPDIYVTCERCLGKRYNRKPSISATKGRILPKSSR
jgi:excinuclease ABC subunit A